MLKIIKTTAGERILVYAAANQSCATCSLRDKPTAGLVSQADYTAAKV